MNPDRYARARGKKRPDGMGSWPVRGWTAVLFWWKLRRLPDAWETCDPTDELGEYMP